jgi:hypothetical protein
MASAVQMSVRESAGPTMADPIHGTTVEDRRAEHEAAVALAVAWLVAIARAFRIDGTREVRLDEEIRAAQADLIRVIRLACADGMRVEEVRARFIDPLRQSGIHEGAAALLAETARVAANDLTQASPT